jgi:hypothetical protein
MMFLPQLAVLLHDGNQGFVGVVEVGKPDLGVRKPTSSREIDCCAAVRQQAEGPTDSATELCNRKGPRPVFQIP